MVDHLLQALAHNGHHGRHAFDFVLGIAGVISGAAVFAVLQGGIALAVGLVSLAVVVIRLQINLMEKREKEKALKDDESA